MMCTHLKYSLFTHKLVLPDGLHSQNTSSNLLAHVIVLRKNKHSDNSVNHTQLNYTSNEHVDHSAGEQ